MNLLLDKQTGFKKCVSPQNVLSKTDCHDL